MGAERQGRTATRRRSNATLMNAKGWSAAELDEEVLRALGSLAADPSAFVLLEGMTRLESPKSLTELSRTFAADPFDIEEALARLVSLRFVDQRGKAFAANESAAAVMHLIRETVAARNVE